MRGHPLSPHRRYGQGPLHWDELQGPLRRTERARSYRTPGNFLHTFDCASLIRHVLCLEGFNNMINFVIF